MKEETLLDVRDLKTHFYTEQGRVTAVDGISFSIRRGETLGVVGESGCGKSVTSESIMRLLNEETTAYEGEVNYKGINLLALSRRQLRDIRGRDISMIFQDPMSSLNPLYTVGNQIAESIIIHQDKSWREAHEIAVEMLQATGIPSPEKRVNEFPHELSGGMRQRVMIAMALACHPSLLIADEPTTALDVTTQAQILDLITSLKNEFDMGVMFITHDIGVVAEVCDRVIVMYLGEVIEDTTVADLFVQPLHPYTQGLMRAMPKIDSDRSVPLYMIEGAVPSLNQVPAGCRFVGRCPHATDLCHDQPPSLEAADAHHKVKCWHWKTLTA